MAAAVSQSCGLLSQKFDFFSPSSCLLFVKILPINQQVHRYFVQSKTFQTSTVHHPTPSSLSTPLTPPYPIPPLPLPAHPSLPNPTSPSLSTPVNGCVYKITDRRHKAVLQTGFLNHVINLGMA